MKNCKNCGLVEWEQGEKNEFLEKHTPKDMKLHVAECNCDVEFKGIDMQSICKGYDKKRNTS